MGVEALGVEALGVEAFGCEVGSGAGAGFGFGAGRALVPWRTILSTGCWVTLVEVRLEKTTSPFL